MYQSVTGTKGRGTQGEGSPRGGGYKRRWTVVSHPVQGVCPNRGGSTNHSQWEGVLLWPVSIYITTHILRNKSQGLDSGRQLGSM